MDINKIYLIQIIGVLLILLCIAIYILCDKTAPMDYNYGELIPIQENYTSDKEYYDYQEKHFKYYKKAEYDEKDIILTEVDNELIYQPANISYYGLRLYSRYIQKGNAKDYELAKKQADYLVETQNKENGGFYHEYEQDVKGTRITLEEPWISSCTQGEALSFLSRMYSVSKEEKYKEACELALIPFTKKLSENGLCAKFLGYDFYEEFPTENPNYFLGGFLYSLLGLYDCYTIIGNEKAKELYDVGIKTLEICLPYYDYNGISLFNLSFMNNDRNVKVYNQEYHRNYIALLKTLNQKENKEVFKYFVEKWEKYVIESK